jgi:hypothetical protein
MLGERLPRQRGFDHGALAGSFPSRMSAAFSAMAMTAALVLPRRLKNTGFRLPLGKS